jgi:hypothetical protein
MSVWIGIDPHKGSHTAVVVDTDEVVVDKIRVKAAATQLAKLQSWASGYDVGGWAIESARGMGYLLAQQLVAAGEPTSEWDHVSGGGEYMRAGALLRSLMLVIVMMLFVAACSSDVGEVIDAAEFIEATSDVLEANGFDGASTLDMDCDDTGGGKNVTCTVVTASGQNIQSKGEDVGADNATLAVTVDGVILYDGLLKDAPGS